MELQRLFVALAIEASEYVNGLDEAQSKASSWSRSIQDAIGGAFKSAGLVALSVLATLGVALGAFAAGGVSAAITMEEQMSSIAAVMGKTKEEIEPLGDLIQELGLNPNLKVTAEEAAAAIEMLARNGLSMGEIMEGAAESTVLLANATGTDLGNAANIATDAMAIFGIEASDMLTAVDGIVSVTTNSKFSIDDFALALAQAGGVASAAGVPFDEFNTSIAAISPLFASGSDAGTSFKTFLQRLIPASNTAGDAMRELGIITEDGSNRFFDAQGNLKSMSEIAGILEGALGGLTEEQRNAALATIFGTDAMRAAVGIMDTGEQGFLDLMGAMSETDALESAATRMDNLGGVMEILGGVMEAIQLSLGTALLPLFRLVADAALAFADGALPRVEQTLTGVATAVQNFVSYLQNGQGLLMSFQMLVFNLASAFGMGNAQANQLATGVGNVLRFVQSVLGPIAAAVTQFVSWKDVLLVLGVAVAAVLIPAVWGLMAPILAVVAVIAGAIAVVALLRNAWESNFLGVRDIVGNVVGQVQAAIGGLIAWWNGAWPSIQTTLQTVWSGVQAVIQSALLVIRPAIDSFVEGVRSGFGSMGPYFEQVKGLWASLQPAVTTVLTVIGAALTVFIGIVVGVFNGIAAAVGPLIQTIISVQTAIVQALTGIVQFVTGFFQLLVGLFTGNSALVEQAWSTMVTGLTNLTTGLVTGIVSLVTGLWQTVQALIGGLVDGVITFFTNLYQTLVGGSIVPDLVNAIVQWITTMKDTFISLVTELWQTVQALFQAAADFLINLIATSWTTMQSTVETITAAMQGFLEATWSAILSFLTATWNSLVAMVTAALNAWSATLMAVMNAINAFLTATWSSILSFLTATWNGIVAMTTAALNALKAVITAVTSAVAALWTAFVQRVVDWWESGWKGILYVVNTGYQTLMSIINSLVQAIFSAFRQDWASIGRDVIEGIRDGIMNAARRLADAAADAARRALEAAKRALGIASPSKEGIDIGVNLFSSIGLGAVRTAGRLARQIGTAVERAVLTPAAAMATPALANGGAVSGRVAGGDQTTIMIDARGASPAVASRIEAAVERALQRHGRRADVIERIR